MTFNGHDYRGNAASAKEMFAVFPIVQQLREMLYYLKEDLNWEETMPIRQDLMEAFQETESLTYLHPESISALDIPVHREKVNVLLFKTSKLARAKNKNKAKRKMKRSRDLIGANLKGANLRGLNLRGALLIAANLRDAV